MHDDASHDSPIVLAQAATGQAPAATTQTGQVQPQPAPAAPPAEPWITTAWVVTAILGTVLGIWVSGAYKKLLGWATKAEERSELANRIAALEQDLAEREQTIQSQQRAQDALRADLAQSAKDRHDAVAILEEPFGPLDALRREIGADRATLYLPVDDEAGDLLGLVAVATAPENNPNEIFANRVIATSDTEAFHCLQTGRQSNPDAPNPGFADFPPHYVMTDSVHPNRQRGVKRPIGVVQFIRKAASGAFTEDEARKIGRETTRFEEFAASFLNRTEQLQRFGFEFDRRAKRGTALIFDISNSSELLMDESKTVLAQAFINDLSRAIYHRLTRLGCVFDNFTGDGFLVSFRGRLDGTSASFARDAVLAAEEIALAFNEISRDYSNELGALATPLYARMGVSTGILHPIEISVRQMGFISIFGKCVSSARHLCDAGPRNANAVMIDAATWAELDEADRAQFEPLSGDPPKKMANRTSGIYQRIGIS